MNNLLLPAFRLTRLHGARLLQQRGTPKILAASRAASAVSKQQLTPKQEDEQNLLVMDLLPTPEKPWAVGLKEQQAYHNKWFSLGVVSMIVTILVGYYFEWERHLHLGDKHVEWQEFSHMYSLYENPKEWMRNPPPFTIRQIQKEAMAECED